MFHHNSILIAKQRYIFFLNTWSNLHMISHLGIQSMFNTFLCKLSLKQSTTTENTKVSDVNTSRRAKSQKILGLICKQFYIWYLKGHITNTRHMVKFILILLHLPYNLFTTWETLCSIVVSRKNFISSDVYIKISVSEYSSPIYAIFSSHVQKIHSHQWFIHDFPEE